MPPIASYAKDASTPILILTNSAEFESMLSRAVANALSEQDTRHKKERRLTSSEAAQHLGCSLSHLQILHKQGLAYEKGRPNFYKLRDLEAYQETRRLQLA